MSRSVSRDMSRDISHDTQVARLGTDWQDWVWRTVFLFVLSLRGVTTPKQGRALVKLAHHNDVPVTAWQFGSD